jgi:hypothetical protein
MAETVREPERELTVIDRADVVVLGGGPAGVAAAVAAGRAGADVLLVERYGCLGGLATGGLVILLVTYGQRGEMLMSGLATEFYDRLKARGVARVAGRRTQESPTYDPELLKAICLDMTQEATVRLLLHAWAVGAVVEGDRIDAIIIESKSGRQAIRGELFVDGTGDGDTAEWAGVPHERSLSPLGLGLCWRWGNVDYPRFQQARDEEAERLADLRERARQADVIWPAQQAWRDDRAFFLTLLPGLDALDVHDLTRCEIEMRGRAMRTYDFYREHVPGFEHATIIDTASQVGTRESRRITGEYVMTKADTPGGRFDDRVGTGVTWFGEDSASPFDFPYRALVPQQIDNVLYTGRCISADHDAHQQTRVINNCFVTGQAAGAAAAVSLRSARAPRDLDIPELQAELTRQGVDTT